MVALTAGRNTSRREGDHVSGGIAAATTLFVGAMVMRNAAGHLIEGQTATGLIGVGVAAGTVDNAAGSAGDVSGLVRTGTHLMANSASTDEITIADINAVCFAVDDQTVAKTDGSSARSPAGIVTDVDAQGVWVRFDEALTAVAAA